MNEWPNRPAEESRAGKTKSSTRLDGNASASDTGRPADSVPLTTGPFHTLPTQFGRYRIDKLLGSGSMGAVYLAFDVQLDRQVALKVARVSAAGSAKLIKRMETEAKAAAKVDHPLICKVFDFGEIDGIRFISLQYIQGEVLKSYLHRVGRKRQPSEAIQLILQVTRALTAAHDKGVIHRDIKPENLMLNGNGEPVIMDFGLARNMTVSKDAGLTQGMIVGTAAYMSPEQAAGKAEGIDHRSDLYALGIILFEMLTGDWPFTGTAMEIMGRKCIMDPPSPLELNPDLHPELAEVCQKLIAKTKEKRYTSGRELIAALEAIDLNVPASSPTQFSSRAKQPPPLPAELPLEFPSRTSTTSAGVSRRGQVVPVRKTPAGRQQLRRSPNASMNDRWRGLPPATRWSAIGAAGVAAVALLAFLLMPGTPDSPGTSTLGDARTKTSAFESPDIDDHSRRDPLAAEDSSPPTARLHSEDVAIVTNPIAPQNSPDVSVVTPAESDSSHVTQSPSPQVSSPAVKQPLLKSSDSAEEEGTAKAGPLNSELDNLIEGAASLVKASTGKDAAKTFDDATKMLRKASNRFSKEIRPDFYLGLLHSGIGINDLNTSETHFKRVLDRSPGHIPTLNNLALVEIKSRRFRPARNYFSLAAQQNPRPLALNQNLGRTLNQAKLLNLKDDEFKRIGSLNTQPNDYQSQTGWLYMPVDDSAKSQEEFKSFSRTGRLEDASCSVCNGRSFHWCTTCNKNGSVVEYGSFAETRNMGFGSINTSTPTATMKACRDCRGTGRIDCQGCRDGRDPSLPLR